MFLVIGFMISELNLLGSNIPFDSFKPDLLGLTQNKNGEKSHERVSPSPAIKSRAPDRDQGGPAPKRPRPSLPPPPTEQVWWKLFNIRDIKEGEGGRRKGRILDKR